jgi:phosphoenolpyruvate synthase/pyruvate phosphate dikinase
LDTVHRGAAADRRFFQAFKGSGKPFPDDPPEQRRAAIEAAFSSWNHKRATD